MTDYEINALRYKALGPVFEDMKDMEYVVVKGEALSLAAYGELGKRTSKDVDILADKEDVYDIEQILVAHGFTPEEEDQKKSRHMRIFLMANSHQTIPYVKKFQGMDVKVDVNFGILWGEYEGQRIDIREFLKGSTERVIHGIRTKVLSKEKTLFHLILHNYKDVNSTYLLLRRKRPIYERVYKDIFLIMDSMTDEELGTLIELSKRLMVDTYVFYMAYYTNQVFPCKKLTFVMEQLKSDEGVALLNAYGLNKLERHQWQCSFEERYNHIEMKDYILDQLGPEEIQKLKANGIYYKEVEAFRE